MHPIEFTYSLVWILYRLLSVQVLILEGCMLPCFFISLVFPHWHLPVWYTCPFFLVEFNFQSVWPTWNVGYHLACCSGSHLGEPTGGVVSAWFLFVCLFSSWCQWIYTWHSGLVCYSSEGSKCGFEVKNCFLACVFLAQSCVQSSWYCASQGFALGTEGDRWLSPCPAGKPAWC